MGGVGLIAACVVLAVSLAMATAWGAVGPEALMSLTSLLGAAVSASYLLMARLAAASLFLVVVQTLRLHPRKTIEIGWSDLIAALTYAVHDLCGFGGQRRSPAALEEQIARRWSEAGDALPCLSVRTGLDLVLSALDLPKGSEVLFLPGITIPAMVEVVEGHGLVVAGAAPNSSQELLPASLEEHVTADTRVVVITHLFGTIFDVEPLISEARQRGLFVVEDCAQAFLGDAVPNGQQQQHQTCIDSRWSKGFRGHEAADACLVSFGIMKTCTCLGGAILRVRDGPLRKKVSETQGRMPARSSWQFLQVVIKACFLKALAGPVAWGLLAAVIGALGMDFDKYIVGGVRGFPHGGLNSLRKRPSLPLLRLLLRRLRDQGPASLEVGCGIASTAMARRRAAGAALAHRLADAGVEVVTNGVGLMHSWWLLPVVDEHPQSLVSALWHRGFDATCSSTQLRSVEMIAKRPRVSPGRLGPHFGQTLMSHVVYLPLSPDLSLRDARELAEAVLEERCGREPCLLQDGGSAASAPGWTRMESRGGGSARAMLAALCMSLVGVWNPGAVLWLFPSVQLLALAFIAGSLLLILCVVVARCLASDPKMRVDVEVLRAFGAAGAAPPAGRSGASPKNLGAASVARTLANTGIALPTKVDGAVLLTGATGFVGGGVLFELLARAEELGITRVVLLVRQKAGANAGARLTELRANPAFEEVCEAFDKLVTVVEGDTSQQDFGKEDGLGAWPFAEPLRVVLHCAGDVRFNQPLQQAALSLISASLQVAELAAQWGARRFVFVSTAFVHAVPTPQALPERLVELRDFDPMELYRDAVSHGRWAEKCMIDLGFPNTYTFAKAIAEHLVLRACASHRLDARIVRPSIVGPAWAAPFPGWSGDKPSTITAGGALLACRGLRVFRSSQHPCPLVPVDVAAAAVVSAMVGPPASSTGARGQIAHATIDSSEASQVPSFQVLMEKLFQVMALRGDFSAPEAGFLFRLLRWAAREDPSAFWLLHGAFNILPTKIWAMFCQVACAAAPLLAFVGVGAGKEAWSKRARTAWTIAGYSTLPVQYLPFTCPSTTWLFHSSIRLPADWDPVKYALIMHRSALAFALTPATGKGRAAPTRSTALAFRDIRVAPPQAAWLDGLLALSTPEAPLYQCVAAFLIRRALAWMDLTVTVDAASLASVVDLAVPLVLCPTHRSLLDFVILGSLCFQMHPMLPSLQVPDVAADAEFSGLPFLGRVLAALGAFFVRRGGGSVQPDPALRANVNGIFHKGRPLEVFLEGLRSRGRRQVRLRSGLLRALRDVTQRTVGLVPVALSYELLPEDQSFYNEMQGSPRAPLRVQSLVQWALQGMRGELPSYGDAHVRLGPARVLHEASDLPTLLSEVQEELITLTTVTALHARALSELLGLPAKDVHIALQAAGLPIRGSRLAAQEKKEEPPRLSDAERWALAIQAAVLLRRRLPPQWGRWLVEPVLERGAAADQATTAPPPRQAETAEPKQGLSAPYPPSGGKESNVEEQAEAGDAKGLDVLVAAFAALLEAAEDRAQELAQVLREGGMTTITEEHLQQQLLRSHMTNGVHVAGLPPPLACGAASIVAGRFAPGMVAGYGAAAACRAKAAGNTEAGVRSLWPTSRTAAKQRCDEESLDRWGFKDTRFVAQWVDGRPAVQVTSQRYGSIGRQPLYQLWSFFQTELGVKLAVRDTLPERQQSPELPPPADGVVSELSAVMPEARICSDAAARLRSGLGHGLADIWMLRACEVPRVPDAVVRPRDEDEVLALLRLAACDGGKGRGFAVVPVGGRTSVTSATRCPSRDVDPRPFVALDMRGLSRVLWVNKEDGLAHVQAGITGMELKEALAKSGVTMGMEPDSMEFSTLGGWIATRASGMKRARYGNIEDMVVQLRVATPAGLLWQHHDNSPGGTAGATIAGTAFGRASTNLGLPGMLLGSEGCLGVVTSAVVRVQPLPEVVEYQSVVFPDWESGQGWMREVARLPACARPASCRLLDQKQLKLAQALREDRSTGPLKPALKKLALRARGVRLEAACAATLVFEGSREEVALQQKLLRRLVRGAGGIWGGASSGEAGYALTFAICYLRDFGLDYRILSESLETMVPWSRLPEVWPAVVAAVRAEHHSLRLPGQPFLSCRMTQLYDEGAVLYMYMAVSTAGLAPEKALEAFEHLEKAARGAAISAGGCISHHHGVGKMRAALLPSQQAPALAAAARGLKNALDPDNVLGARNGMWADDAMGILPDVGAKPVEGDAE